MRKRSARGTISRESVADAALAIADRAGFDAVTMRATAAEVGATPMALYTYFASKERVACRHARAGPRACLRGVRPAGGRGSRRSRGCREGSLRRDSQAPPDGRASDGAPQHGPASAGLSCIDESLGQMLKDGFGFDAAARGLPLRGGFRRWERAQRAFHHGCRRWVCEVSLAFEGTPSSQTRALWEPSFLGGTPRRLSLERRLRVRNPFAADGHRGPTRAPGKRAYRNVAGRALDPHAGGPVYGENRRLRVIERSRSSFSVRRARRRRASRRGCA